MKTSQALFDQAKKYIPGGVNSPVRAYNSVGGTPPFIAGASGSKIRDVEGNEYIDYVMSWGPMILGHAPQRVIDAVNEQMQHGNSFGAPTEIEVTVAQLIVEAVPSIDKVRMVNSGTEAAMSAIRLARAYTGRDKLIKFEGCYHGHSDSFLIQAGSGALTFGEPNSPGVTAGAAADTVLARYNDIESVKKVIAENKDRIAALILEPVAGNMGCIPPADGFLQALRELTAAEGIVLIFDEVITGFRLSLGGAQKLFGVTPDMTILGKIIGGGFPVGAYGGRKDIMDIVAPDGPAYQAGTLSGNPVAMRAGYETLMAIKEDPQFYEKLDKTGAALAGGIAENLKSLGLDFYTTRIGSMSSLFFTGQKVDDLDAAKRSDTEKFARYFHQMLERGVYLAPSQFETGFVSAAHSGDDIEKTVKANYDSLKAVFG